MKYILSQDKKIIEQVIRIEYKHKWIPISVQAQNYESLKRDLKEIIMPEDLDYEKDYVMGIEIYNNGSSIGEYKLTPALQEKQINYLMEEILKNDNYALLTQKEFDELKW